MDDFPRLPEYRGPAESAPYSETQPLYPDGQRWADWVVGIPVFLALIYIAYLCGWEWFLWFYVVLWGD